MVSKKNILIISLLALSILLSLFLHYRYNNFNYYMITLEPLNKKSDYKDYFVKNFSMNNFADFLQKNNVYNIKTTGTLDYTLSAIEQKHPENFYIKHNSLIHKLHTEGAYTKLTLFFTQRKVISNEMVEILVNMTKTRILQLYSGCISENYENIELVKALKKQEEIFQNYINHSSKNFIEKEIILDEKYHIEENKDYSDIKGAEATILLEKYPKLKDYLIKKESEFKNSEIRKKDLYNKLEKLKKNDLCVSMDNLSIKYDKGEISRLNFFVFLIFVSSILFLIIFNLNILFSKGNLKNF